MRYFSLQGPFAQVIFVAFQSGNLICIVTILLANTDVWLLWGRKLPINRIKTLSRFALRRLHARATGDSRGTAVSGTQCQERTPSPSRYLICQTTKYMYLEY